MPRIELGDRVRDRLTGFEGIAAATAQYLTGCDRVGIAPRTLKESGEIRDTVWFDQPWVEVLEKKAVSPVEPRAADAGGPGRGVDLSRGL